MKLIRPIVALAVGLSVVLVGHAGAAPKLACKLITDGPGDAQPINSEHLHATLESNAGVPIPKPPAFKQGPSSDALDILSADVASDKRKITAVIRVKKLAVTSPTAAPTGSTWYMQSTLDGTDFTMSAHTDPTGAKYFDAAYVSATGGTLYGGGVTGVLDLVKNEVRITAELSLFEAQATIKPGVKLTNISVAAANEVAVFDKSNRLFAGGGIFEWAIVSTDTASTTKTYAASAKNCVLVGK